MYFFPKRPAEELRGDTEMMAQARGQGDPEGLQELGAQSSAWRDRLAAPCTGRVGPSSAQKPEIPANGPELAPGPCSGQSHRLRMNVLRAWEPGQRWSGPCPRAVLAPVCPSRRSQGASVVNHLPVPCLRPPPDPSASCPSSASLGLQTGGTLASSTAHSQGVALSPP